MSRDVRSVTTVIINRRRRRRPYRREAYSSPPVSRCGMTETTPLAFPCFSFDRSQQELPLSLFFLAGHRCAAVNISCATFLNEMSQSDRDRAYHVDNNMRSVRCLSSPGRLAKRYDMQVWGFDLEGEKSRCAMADCFIFLPGVMLAFRTDLSFNSGNARTGWQQYWKICEVCPWTGLSFVFTAFAINDLS